jgi:hypothetical protein
MGHDNGVCATKVVVEQTLHGAVHVVRHEDINKFKNSTVQTSTIISRHILPPSKANVASLGSIVINSVACEFISHKQVHHQQFTRPNG